MPSDSGDGPVTLYIGPGADEAYPVMAEQDAYDPGVVDMAPIARWCPGIYQGQIWNTGPTNVHEDNFSFRISASKRVKPLPAPTVARHLKPVTVTPQPGRPGTIFAVRYRADATDPTVSGDVVAVNGPAHSACRGRVVWDVAERSDWTSGRLTLDIGPGADRKYYYSHATGVQAESPTMSHGPGLLLRRWCTGTYQGRILFEKFPKLVVVRRFTLTVVAGPRRAARPKRVSRRVVVATSVYLPVSSAGLNPPLPRWCEGTYRGTILYENLAKLVVVARFKLAVAG